jgi:hypothetical protein
MTREETREMDKENAIAKFDSALVAHYGTIIEKKDLNLLRAKIDAVVTAHCFAGNLGTNPLCQINQCFEKNLPTTYKKNID